MMTTADDKPGRDTCQNFLPLSSILFSSSFDIFYSTDTISGYYYPYFFFRAQDTVLSNVDDSPIPLLYNHVTCLEINLAQALLCIQEKEKK